MPFDSSHFDDLSVFTPGLVGLKKLSQLLRKEMPNGFYWNFTHYKINIDEFSKREEIDSFKYNRYYPYHYLHRKMQVEGCNTAGCAIGLAVTVWPEVSDMLINTRCGRIISCLPDEKKVAKYFGITKSEAGAIFFSMHLYRTTNVTSHMVADKIDLLLKEKYGIV